MSISNKTFHIDLESVDLTDVLAIEGTILSIKYHYVATNSKDVDLKLESFSGLAGSTEVWDTVLEHNGSGGSLPADNERKVYVQSTEYVTGGTALAEVYPVLAGVCRWVASDPGAGIEGDVYIFMTVQTEN